MEIERKRNELDFKVYMTMEEKQKQLTLKKEYENLKRKDRVKTVERIQRQNEYQKSKVQRKIELDNMRSLALKSEKEQIMEKRKVMRKEAEI